MATIAWKTGTSGVWASAPNWAPAQVPGAADDVLINGAASYLVTVAGVTVDSVALNDPSAALLTGGVFTVGNALAINAGTLEIAAGTVIVIGRLTNDGTILDTGSLELFGSYDAASLARIGGSGGTLALAGSLANTGGTLDGTGFDGLRIASLGTIQGGVVTGLTQSGAATLDGVTWQGPLNTGNSPLTIRNGLVETGAGGIGAGAMTIYGSRLDFQGDQTLDDASVAGSGTIVAENNLTLGPKLSIGIANFGALAFYGPDLNSGEISNDGKIVVTGETAFPGDPGVSVSIVVADFENYGTVETAGAAGLASDSYISVASGNFDNHPGALLGAYDGRLIFAASSVLTNDGTIAADAGSAYIGGFLLGTGLVSIANGATVEVASAAAATQRFSLSGSVTLKLDQPAFFGSAIDGFAPGDTLDLGLVATATNYSAGDLKLRGDSGQMLDLAISGPYSLSNFIITSAGGGTMVQVNNVSSSAPTVSGAGNNVMYVSGGTAVAVDPGLTITDPGSATLIGATVMISGGVFVGDGDILSADTIGTAVIASFNSTNEVLTLTGTDTLADYQQVLGSVTFASSVADPSKGTSQPSRSVTWVVNDGSATSAPVASTVNIQPPPRTLAWTGAKNTDFATAANWNDTTNSLNPAVLAPDAADTAQFITGGGTIAGTGTVTNLAFGGSSWRLSAGAALSATNGVAVGTTGSGALTLSGGASIFTLGSFDSVSGSGGNSAYLTVDGKGSAWSSNGELVVGQQGSGGTLTIQNQGALTSGFGLGAGSGLVISDTGGFGSVVVTGAGSLLANSGQFVVGNSGFASLLIASGGEVQTSRPGADFAAPSADIGAGAGSDGSNVSVNGTGSTWQVYGPLVVGGAASGSLAISAGGAVIADQLDAGENASGAGIISVVGTGSAVTLTGSLIVGDGASAELSILSGGMVSAGNADIGVQAGATGNVDIEGAGSHLDIANDLTIGVAGVGVLTLGAGTELTVVNNLVVGANGVLNQFGGVIDPSTITIVAGGRQGGHGTTTASVEISNAGTLFASSGIETVNTPLITAPSGKSGVLEIDAGGDLVLNAASVDATQSVTFTDGTGVLTIGTIGGFGGTISSVTAGDEIIVQGTSIASDSFDPATHVLTLFDAGNATIGALQLGALVDGATLLANGTGGIGVAPCFVAGTRISTERGEVAVEDLRIGDRVQVVAQRPLPGPAPRSAGGLGRGPAQPVIWIGHRTVDCARHPQPRKVWPVRIEAGAFGPGRPLRELWLSPDHALYIGDVLIPVKHLINGGSIAQVAIDEVTYYHVELPRHAVVLAEGLAAESYLDTGDRSNFANPNGAIALYPDFASRIWDAAGCAPLVVTGAELEAAQGWVNTVALMSQHSALPKAMAG